MALNRHFRNMFYLFSGDLAARAVGFLATAYLARVLGKANFGVIHIALALLSYTMLLGNCGLTLWGTRRIAAGSDDTPELTGQVLFIRLMLAFLAFLLVTCGIAFFIADPVIARTVLVYQIYLFPAALLLDWYLQGRQQMAAVATARFGGMLAYLLFVVFFVRNAAEVVNTAWGWVAGGLVNTLALAWLFHRQGYLIRLRGATRNIIQHLKAAFPLGIAGLISQVAIQFPVLYLGWFSGSEAAGIFSAAFRLTVMLLVFDRMFYTVFFPAISQCAQQTPERLEAVFGRILKIVIFFALSLSLLAMLLAPELLSTIFGAEYLAAVPAFRMLTVYFVLTITNSVIGYTLLGMGQDRTFTRAFLAGLAGLLLSIYPLTAFFDSIGAVSALNLYHLIAVILMARALRRQLPLRIFRHILLPLAATFLILSPAIYFLNWGLFGKFLLVCAGAIPAIAGLSGIGRAEIDYLKRALR